MKRPILILFALFLLLSATAQRNNKNGRPVRCRYRMPMYYFMGY